MANVGMPQRACLLFCLLAIAPLGSALQCYVCNSIKDEGCSGQPDAKYLRNCSELSDSIQYTLCRKINQIVPPSEGLDTRPRTIRGCGWEPAHADCYEKQRYGGIQHVCSCYTDGCNGVSSKGASQATLSFYSPFLAFIVLQLLSLMIN